MMVVGTHEEDPNTPATIILWEWEAGIPLPPLPTAMEENPLYPMNTTTDATTAADTNAATATEEEQQQ
jgi:hypothetical protein